MPSHLYCYSFELNPDWTYVSSPGAEIQEYFEDVAKRYEVESAIRLGDPVVRCEWQGGCWEVETAAGYVAHGSSKVAPRTETDREESRVAIHWGAYNAGARNISAEHVWFYWGVRRAGSNADLVIRDSIPAFWAPSKRTGPLSFLLGLLVFHRARQDGHG